MLNFKLLFQKDRKIELTQKMSKNQMLKKDCPFRIPKIISKYKI